VIELKLKNVYSCGTGTHMYIGSHANSRQVAGGVFVLQVYLLIHLLITIGLASNKQKGWPAIQYKTDTVIKKLLVWFPAAPCRGKVAITQ